MEKSQAWIELIQPKRKRSPRAYYGRNAARPDVDPQGNLIESSLLLSATSHRTPSVNEWCSN
jgi:hypothetical protein